MYIPNAVDKAILFELYRFHYLTLDQLLLVRGYSHNSRKYTGSILKNLVAMKFVHIEPVPRYITLGRLPALYTLGTKGIAYFRLQDSDMKYFAPSERKKKLSYIDHTLEVNDVLIAARRLSHLVPQIELEEFRHDLDLQQDPVKIGGDEKKTARVVPDGFLKFQLSPPFADPDYPVFAALLELDRDTLTKADRYKAKIRSLVALADGPYQETFGTSSLHILWVATRRSIRRVHQMRRWTLEELTRLDKIEYADLFRYVYLPLAQACIFPRGLFLAPGWWTLEDDRTVPLIDSVHV